MIMAAIGGEGGHACSHHHTPPSADTAVADRAPERTRRAVRERRRPEGARRSPEPDTVRTAERTRSGGTSRRGALRAAMAGALGVAGATVLAGEAAAAVAPTASGSPVHLLPSLLHSGRVRMADLTHPLSADFPVFERFVRKPQQTQVMFEDEIGFNTAEWTFNEHSGTHIDVPAHWENGLATVDEIELKDLVAPLVVIRIAERAEQDNVTGVTVADIRAWERVNGRVPRRAFVAMDSGWYRRVDSPGDFLNVDPATGATRFPGFTAEAADFLVTGRGVVGLGVDTPSLDIGADPEPVVHSILLTTGHYGLENLAALDQVPDKGATLMIGAPRLRGGFGAPVRAMALI
jgi:kynurenine formamidase